MAAKKNRSRFALPELERSANRRPARVGDCIRREVSMLVIRGIKDPRVGYATITRVSVSPDLRNARIFFACAGRDPGEVEAGLSSAKGYIRSHLARELGMRFVPKLNFCYDSAMDVQNEMDQLFRELADERKRNTP